MVEILIALYNSSKYIREQIESIENQTYKNIKIIVRDDDSTDNTLDIIEELKNKYHNIQIVFDNVKCGNPKDNFGELIKHASAEYIMFCDHDDVWLDNKVEISVNAISRFDDIPTMGSTDSILVDEKLENIDSNKLETSKKTDQFSRLLVDNCYMGCTMILNKKLYNMINNIPKECLMHDIWVALVASSMGKIVIIPEKCMLYRQHGNNCVGGKNVFGISYALEKIKDKSTKNNIQLLISQASAFKTQYYNCLDKKNKMILDAFIDIYKTPKMKRLYTLIKYNLFKTGFFRKLGEIYYVIRG